VTIDEAIRSLRQDPRYADLVRDAYLGRDVADSFRRFEASDEFQAVCAILGDRLRGATILDLGAGTGIASLAFSIAGAGHVIAVDPDPSDEVGRGAMIRLGDTSRFEVRDGVGESIPESDNSVDIVYCRQMLHHARDLNRVLVECQRVLKPGGLLLACREHVVDDRHQLAVFLASHPVHQLAGGENAFALSAYVEAIQQSGLVLERVIGPMDSVINAFPAVRTTTELQALPREKLVRRLGPLGRLAWRVPGVPSLVRAHLNRAVPGRMYSFVAHKGPEDGPVATDRYVDRPTGLNHDSGLVNEPYRSV
jgi:ubiquinone/menaquinone biosynthesis C-methylase UbiE